MNILPKKSWHVANKKNIERVRRDEAEAEERAKIEQDRILQVQQELRARELRQRAGIEEQAHSGHINLFEEDRTNESTTNRDHRNDKKSEEEKWQQKVGILKKLVRSEDVNKPWYCDNSNKTTSAIQDRHPNEATKRNAALITSIYDPMTAIKAAEHIVKTRHMEKRKLEESVLRRSAHSSHEQKTLALELYKPAKVESSSSPEMVKYVRSDKKKKSDRVKDEKRESRKRGDEVERRHRHKHKHKRKKSSRHKHKESRGRNHKR